MIATEAQSIIIRVCNGERHVFEKMHRKTADVDTQACLDAGWLVAGSWRYAATPAGVAAAGVQHDVRAYAERMGHPVPPAHSELPLGSAQLDLFDLAEVARG